jgi:hypothetical protein
MSDSRTGAVRNQYSERDKAEEASSQREERRNDKVSEATWRTLTELRRAFDLTSESEVVRRCIALALVLVRQASDGKIRVIQNDNSVMTIQLRGSHLREMVPLGDLSVRE